MVLLYLVNPNTSKNTNIIYYSWSETKTKTNVNSVFISGCQVEADKQIPPSIHIHIYISVGHAENVACSTKIPME